MTWNTEEIPAHLIVDYFTKTSGVDRYDYHHPLIPQLHVKVEKYYYQWVWIVRYMDIEITRGEYISLTPALSYVYSFVHEYANHILPKRI